MIKRRLENEVNEANEVVNNKEGINEKDFMEALMEEVRNKTLNIVGEFNENLVKEVQMFADNLWYYHEDDEKPCFINISSYGGSADCLLAILDILKGLKEEWGCKIITNCNGYAMSCGAILWAYGDERHMGEYGELMFHQLSYGIRDTLEAHEVELKRNKKLQKKIDRIICEKTPLTEKTLKKWYKNSNDKFIDYDEAMELGLLTIEEEDDEE